MARAQTRVNPELAPWESLTRELLLDRSPWLRVWRESVRLPTGRVLDDFYTVEQPDFVSVFALTDAEQVVGLWHYKHGPGRVHLGLPAGYKAPGESALAAAQRELLEETGYEAADWLLLGAYTRDGNRNCGRGHLFLARGAHYVMPPDSGDDQAMEVELIPLADLQRHLRADVATLGTAAAIGLALNALHDGNASS